MIHDSLNRRVRHSSKCATTMLKQKHQQLIALNWKMWSSPFAGSLSMYLKRCCVYFVIENDVFKLYFEQRILIFFLVENVTEKYTFNPNKHQ